MAVEIQELEVVPGGHPAAQDSAKSQEPNGAPHPELEHQVMRTLGRLRSRDRRLRAD